MNETEKAEWYPGKGIIDAMRDLALDRGGKYTVIYFAGLLLLKSLLIFWIIVLIRGTFF